MPGHVYHMFNIAGNEVRKSMSGWGWRKRKYLLFVDTNTTTTRYFYYAVHVWHPFNDFEVHWKSFFGRNLFFFSETRAAFITHVACTYGVSQSCSSVISPNEFRGWRQESERRMMHFAFKFRQKWLNKAQIGRDTHHRSPNSVKEKMHNTIRLNSRQMTRRGHLEKW